MTVLLIAVSICLTALALLFAAASGIAVADKRRDTATASMVIAALIAVASIVVMGAA